MAVLDQLKITNVTQKKDTSPVGRFRRRLVDALELQIDLAKADGSGVPLNRTRQRWVRNEPDGKKELRQVPVRLRRWWWKDDSGKVFLSLKHGARPLELAPGKKAIEIGSVDELPTKLAILCEAVRAGELDACVPPSPFGRTAAKKRKPEATPTKASSAKA